MGFLGTSLPAEKGGVGGTFLDEAIVLEEQVENNLNHRCVYLRYFTRTITSKMSVLLNFIFVSIRRMPIVTLRQ